MGDVEATAGRARHASGLRLLGLLLLHCGRASGLQSGVAGAGRTINARRVRRSSWDPKRAGDAMSGLRGVPIEPGRVLTVESREMDAVGSGWFIW
jgi:hypothetical protein